MRDDPKSRAALELRGVFARARLLDRRDLAIREFAMVAFCNVAAGAFVWMPLEQFCTMIIFCIGFH